MAGKQAKILSNDNIRELAVFTAASRRLRFAQLMAASLPPGVII
jgi:hypothetical protein